MNIYIVTIGIEKKEMRKYKKFGMLFLRETASFQPQFSVGPQISVGHFELIINGKF